MRPKRIASVTLAAAVLTACGDDATSPSTNATYFPLSVGNTWTYAPEEPQYGGPLAWLVTGRRGDTITLARPVDDGSHRGAIALLGRGDSVELWIGDEGFVPFLRFTLGASWTRRAPWSCDDGATWVVVEEPAPITTPAGVFTDCLRLERRTAATCDDAGTMAEWWAPGVGLVRWDELNFYAGGPLTFQLINYSVE